MSLLNGTMTPIYTVTVGSGGQSAIEFNNIPQTYTDLYILLSLRDTASSNWQYTTIEFNNSAANVSSKGLFQYNNSAGSGNWPSNIFIYNNSNSSTSSTFGNMSVYIPNYTSSNFKSISADYVSETNGNDAIQGFTAGLWSNSAAITSIKFVPSSLTYMQHSTATLYGIQSISVPAKATGGVITSDENYYYHTFTTSQTFTPKQNITGADILVIAGGGGGSTGPSYGAGAGGLLGWSSQSFSVQNYNVTVGAGGPGGAGTLNGPVTQGTQGSNSVIGSYTTAIGGGLGACEAVGGNGGSGGGGFGAGQRTVNQGFNGGTTGSSNYNGGGGGAGAVGGNAPSGNGGIGATVTTLVGGTAGPYSFINDMAAATGTGQLSSGNYYYAGGGGAGSLGSAGIPRGFGGLGGGGDGGIGVNDYTLNYGYPGTAFTGGGGGGGGYYWPGGNYRGQGGNGGSGIVIVRYPK